MLYLHETYSRRRYDSLGLFCLLMQRDISLRRGNLVWFILGFSIYKTLSTRGTLIDSVDEHGNFTGLDLFVYII